MNYNVVTTPYFKNQLKKLSRKYPSLKSDFKDFVKELSVNPIQGNHLGNNLYKVRFRIKSKQKGKSGGARVLTYIIHTNQEVYLVYLYDKGELETISKQKLLELLKIIVL